mgnify:CR=1 FL=1
MDRCRWLARHTAASTSTSTTTSAGDRDHPSVADPCSLANANAHPNAHPHLSRSHCHEPALLRPTVGNTRSPLPDPPATTAITNALSRLLAHPQSRDTLYRANADADTNLSHTHETFCASEALIYIEHIS